MPAGEASVRAERTRVPLPGDVVFPIEVYVNGVKQEHGRDFTLDGRTIVFDRPLRREGRLGFWRWASMFLGVAGTYRQNDTVDVIYTTGGRRAVAGDLLRESA